MTRRGKVHIPQGDILQPIAGTTCYGPDGKKRGVWGVTVPIELHVQEGDKVRPLTRAERRAYLAWERGNR